MKTSKRKLFGVIKTPHCFVTYEFLKTSCKGGFNIKLFSINCEDKKGSSIKVYNYQVYVI